MNCILYVSLTILRSVSRNHWSIMLMEFRPQLGKMKKEEGKNRMKGEGNIMEHKFLPGKLSCSVQLKLSSPCGNTTFHILLAVANVEVVKE